MLCEAFLVPPLLSGTKAQYSGVVCYEQTVNKILKVIISSNFIKIFYYYPSEVFTQDSNKQ